MLESISDWLVRVQMGEADAVVGSFLMLICLLFIGWALFKPVNYIFKRCITWAKEGWSVHRKRRTWISRERKRAIDTLFADIITEGVEEARYHDAITREEANAIYARAAKGMGLWDLLPKGYGKSPHPETLKRYLKIKRASKRCKAAMKPIKFPSEGKTSAGKPSEFEEEFLKFAKS